MELVQQAVQISVIEQPMTHQFHLSEDINVPDAKEDMMQILQSYGKVYIQEMQSMEQYLKVKGKIQYQVLYATENEAQRIGCIEGTLEMEEMIYVEGGESYQYYVRCNQLDLRGVRIHSRKFSLKGFVELEVQKTCVQGEQITLDVEEGADEGTRESSSYCKQYHNATILELYDTKEDIYRLKEELKLSGTKENIASIIMSRMGNVKLDSRASSGEIEIHGEMEFFSMYMSHELKEDYVAQNISFHGRVECQGIEESMLHYLRYEVEDLSVDTQMDEDGEPRILHIEATIKMHINIYTEKEYQLLDDMYILERKCQLTRTPLYLESLLLHNQSKCKIVEILSLPELKDEVLQVCTANGRIQIEHMGIAEDKKGIVIEGILHMEVLYIKGDDRCPYGAWQGMIPFSHMVECINMEQVSYSVDSYLEQIAISMAGNGEVEIKGVVNFHSFIRNQQVIDVITNLEIEEFSKAELEEQAGIIGYIYKEEDNMWNVAKYFHTTKEGILKNNKLDEKDIKAGQKLLIFKENVSIL